MVDWTNYYLMLAGESILKGIGEGIGDLLGITATILIVCLIATPFIKRLIKYAINEYNKQKDEQ